jgi:predicted 3-demethylubiquinone-9 3-methyltransferase (glyoxalase superfamily)
MPNITPFLWFDTQAEEAAKFYTTVFSNLDRRNDLLWRRRLEAARNGADRRL